ncbi:MAG: acetylornithine aminotransferase [Deltaproteobacteria bacterium RBG_13_49_15]|nr:MAG: acetylornithine aminotransferase [Deltaproteobacteria bacterium RBG_13_49_15]
MSRSIIEKADRVIFATYQRQPVLIQKGEGCRVWDSEGRTYTDFVAGIAVCNLGHAHPRIAKVLSEQARTLWHVSNLYYTQPQVELASYLVKKCFADRVFFCNSGAEANEAAIKLARRYFKEKGEKDRYRIVAMEQSFHGRTMATLSATGQEKVKSGFAPLLDGFDFVPFNDIEALRRKISGSTCAVLMEPIQGEGGIRCPEAGFLESVRRLCDETRSLLIFDEIQTGMGRTGRLFAHQHFNVEPDIMTLAKALGNGLPIGAMLARETVAGGFGPGSHASTFGGTPIVCAASLEVLKIMDEEKVPEHCAEIGAYFKKQLEELKDKYEFIEDVRGMGLLLGMKVKEEGDAIVGACRDRGFLINCIQGNVLRFVPPLIIEKEEIDSLISCLDDVLNMLTRKRDGHSRGDM